MAKKLTHKQAYEIIRDNTNWMWVFERDVRFKDGWIFHRTRDDQTMEYHTCRQPIDCYYIDSLHSMEIVGHPLEAWSGCEVKDSPFISKNQEVVKETIYKLNSFTRPDSSRSSYLTPNKILLGSLFFNSLDNLL